MTHRSNFVNDFRSRFGFHCTPFTREIAVKDRFYLDTFEEALVALLRAVAGRQSAGLIAPAGTGKTALIRALEARLPEARYRVHYVKTTDLSKRDMCREIAVACGAEPAGAYNTLVRRLQERFLTATQDDGLHLVLVLDEAHDLRPDVLGMMRVLTNFDMDSRLVVSILLVGQTPLRELLKRDSLEAVTRRLAHLGTLRLLSKDESHRYLAHRCAVAGATTVPFAPGAMEGIYGIASGNLRATDQLALKALEVAHDTGASIVDPNHVAQARRTLWP